MRPVLATLTAALCALAWGDAAAGQTCVTTGQAQPGDVPFLPADASGDFATGCGIYSKATGTGAVTYGDSAGARGFLTTAIGSAAIGYGDWSTALGSLAFATGDGSTALGALAQSHAPGSVAIGRLAISVASDAVALGQGAIALHANSIALGAGSLTRVGAQSGYAAAFVGASDSTGEVQVGGRTLGGLAAGGASDDAVNVAQLGAGVNQAIAESRRYTDAQIGALGALNTNIAPSVAGTAGAFQVSQDNTAAATPTGANATAAGAGAAAAGANASALGSGSNAAGSGATALGAGASASAANSVALGAGSLADQDNTVSLGSAGGERRVVNMAAGVAATDAVNLGQLSQGLSDTLGQAKSYTDQRLQQTRDDLWNMDRDLRGGIAAAMAMSGLPQAYLPGKSMAAVAASSYRGQTGLAIGVSRITESGRYVYDLKGSGSNSGDWGFAVGAGIQW